MDFSWTDTQKALWDEISSFGRDELEHNLIERDANLTFSESNWQAVADKGLLGLHMPTTYGGRGYDLVTSVHALEALGYGCPDNGFTLGVCGHIFTVLDPIFRFGTEEQKQKYLPKMIDGTYCGSQAVTEPASGSDAFGIQTTAKAVDGGYILNGHKTYIGLAPIADVILVYATVNPDAGLWGVTVFIVDGDADGLAIDPPQSKMGLRTGPMSDIRLNDVFVPKENLLAREGAGGSIFNTSMKHERSFIFSSHIGSMARQLDEAIDYAKSRHVGGNAIGKYQSVSNRIADMKVRLETARLFLYKAASLIDQGHNAVIESAMAKLVISELFVENSFDAIRIHGGQGYVTAGGVERDLRDAIGGVIYGGTSDIQRNVIAALLGV